MKNNSQIISFYFQRWKDSGNFYNPMGDYKPNEGQKYVKVRKPSAPFTICYRQAIKKRG